MHKNTMQALEFDIESSTEKRVEEPRLLHEKLHEVPQTVRFGISGILINVLFMIVYNLSVFYLEHKYSGSTIYAITYLAFIPIGHAITCLTVFGWPKPYHSSLLSNAPIGLLGMAVGTKSTQLLDRFNFNKAMDDMLQRHFSIIFKKKDSRDVGEVYSSIVVMIITGTLSYVLSTMVNSPSKAIKEDEKKEL